MNTSKQVNSRCLIKSLIPFLILAIALRGVSVVCAQFGSGHKSKVAIERMTPRQRVEEYCREYVRHGLVDSDYRDLIKAYVWRDGVRVAIYLAEIIDEYDPARLGARSNELAERAYACTTLLPQMDENVVRLKGLDQGRRAIEAMRALLERMRDAHFDTSESYDQRNTYEILVSGLKEIEGINYCDDSIRNTLKLRYSISLSDKELSDFTSYLVSRDPYYPGWSESEEYKDMTQRNEAGNPIWYLILKNPEPFHKAYLQYKGLRG